MKKLFLILFLSIISCSEPHKYGYSGNILEIDSTSYSGNYVYRLGEGDNLRVIIYREDDLSGEFEIDADGFISLPYIQSIKAKGYTINELTKNITNLFVKEEILRNPKVSIDVLNYRPFYIHGEVNDAGDFPYESNMDIKNAVALAGGYTYRANQDYAFVLRQGSKGLLKVDISKGRFPVYPGDNIEIPERYF